MVVRRAAPGRGPVGAPGGMRMLFLHLGAGCMDGLSVDSADYTLVMSALLCMLNTNKKVKQTFAQD